MALAHLLLQRRDRFDVFDFQKLPNRPSSHLNPPECARAHLIDRNRALKSQGKCYSKREIMTIDYGFR